MRPAKRKTQVEECWSLTLPELFALRLPNALADSDDRLELHALHRDAGPFVHSLGIGSLMTPVEILLAFHTERGGLRWQRLGIERTRQRLGGERLWIVCGCGRRTSKVRLPYAIEDKAEATFACRDCHQLTYRSAQEAHREERIERKFSRRLAASRTATTFAAMLFERLPDASGDLAEAIADAVQWRARRDAGAGDTTPRTKRRSEGRGIVEAR